MAIIQQQTRYQFIASHIDQRAYCRFTALYFSALISRACTRESSVVTVGQIFRRGQKFRLTPEAIRQRGAILRFSLTYNLNPGLSFSNI